MEEEIEYPLKYSICGDIIETNCFGWKDGNNAYPINDGRCCDDCNYLYVIPARYKMTAECKGGDKT